MNESDGSWSRPRRRRQSEIREHLGVRLVLGEDRVARVAVLRDRAAVAGLVRLVVAAEAAQEILVADVVGMGAPAELHAREDVAEVDPLDRDARALHEGAALLVDLRV